MSIVADIFENAVERAAVYRLLARLWRAEVDAELLRALRSGETCEAFEAAGGFTFDGDESALLDNLAVDFCRTFVGPTGHVVPVQSVWNSGQFEGQASVSFRGYIEVIGDPDEWLSRSPLDHVSVQLDAMGRVIEQIDNCILESPNQMESLCELARRFYREHLAWASRMCEAAAARCQTAFYRAVIRMTSEFLEQERLHLFGRAATQTAETIE